MDQTSKLAGSWPRWRRRALVTFLFLLFAVLIYAVNAIYHANFHVVVAGEAYRSGQMDAEQLARVIHDHGIKSIVNLQGTNAKAKYQDEIATAARLGVQHYDFSLPATEEITLSQMDEIIRTLRAAPKPVLIHCKAGADRAGLVSALYCLAINGQSPAQADRELSIWYGHVPWIPSAKTIAMDRSYWHYVSNQLAHAELNTRPAAVSP